MRNVRQEQVLQAQLGLCTCHGNTGEVGHLHMQTIEIHVTVISRGHRRRVTHCERAPIPQTKHLATRAAARSNENSQSSPSTIGAYYFSGQSDAVSPRDGRELVRCTPHTAIYYPSIAPTSSSLYLPVRDCTVTSSLSNDGVSKTLVIWLACSAFSQNGVRETSGT